MMEKRTRLELALDMLEDCQEGLEYVVSLLSGDVHGCAHVNRSSTTTFGKRASWWCADCKEEIYEDHGDGCDPSDTQGSA